MTVNKVPEGWYPDPEAPERLRYWDGTAWTGHISPSPHEPVAPTQPETPAVDSGGDTTVADEDEEFVFTDEELGITPPTKAKRRGRRNSSASEPATGATHDNSAAPKDPLWTGRTFLVLGLCLALAIAGVVGGALIITQPSRVQASDAEATLDKFLEATTTGDPAWMDYTSPGLAEEFAVSSPFRGDPEVAQTMGLEVEYDVLDMHLNSQNPAEAYYAKGYVELKLMFTHLDKEIVHETVQTVWLTRPFFENGTVGFPDQLSQPDAVGEWKVASLSSIKHDEAKWGWPFPFNTNFHEQLGDSDADPCLFVGDILEEISTSAREQNHVQSQCFYGGPENFPGAEYLDKVGFTNGIPLIEPFEDDTVPIDIIGIRGKSADEAPLKFLDTPLLQFRFQSSEETYVVTMSVIQESTYRSSYNIIRIDQVEVS